MENIEQTATLHLFILALILGLVFFWSVVGDVFFNDFYDFLKWFLKIFCVIMFFTIGMLRQDLASNGSRPKGLW